MVKAAIVGVLALVAVGCGSEDEGPDDAEQTQLAGTYNGEIVIANTDPPVSVTTTLSLSGPGVVSGTTTGLAGSGAPGEKGTISGAIDASVPTSVDFDLTFESATLGRYTGTGKGVYAAQTGDLAASLTGKKEGTYVGDFIITVTKE
ncbi:hypothetical protein [Sorangium sp. So ce887]|uniref:hypothetical protein n=1 Tax=Sorangium sp. So ce887 TaxID=3133324 RepID=UPI003F62080F